MDNIQEKQSSGSAITPGKNKRKPPVFLIILIIILSCAIIYLGFTYNNLKKQSENIEVKQKLRQTEIEKEELTVQKEELTQMIEKASVLSAKNIVITPLNKRSKENLRSDKVEKIRTCFTIRENPVISPGNKIIYLRIARPDDVILTSGVNLFEYQGEQVVFSASREVQYENVDIELCIFWTNDGQLIPGTYRLNIYVDGNDIGSITFAL